MDKKKKERNVVKRTYSLPCRFHNWSPQYDEMMLNRSIAYNRLDYLIQIRKKIFSNLLEKMDIRSGEIHVKYDVPLQIQTVKCIPDSYAHNEFYTMSGTIPDDKTSRMHTLQHGFPITASPKYNAASRNIFILEKIRSTEDSLKFREVFYIKLVNSKSEEELYMSCSNPSLYAHNPESSVYLSKYKGPDSLFAVLPTSQCKNDQIEVDQGIFIIHAFTNRYLMLENRVYLNSIFEKEKQIACKYPKYKHDIPTVWKFHVDRFNN